MSKRNQFFIVLLALGIAAIVVVFGGGGAKPNTHIIQPLQQTAQVTKYDL